jgi:sugar phosphate isomerase/epimerase
MKFGALLPLDQADIARSAGFDYLEDDIQRLLRPDLPDEQWTAPPLPSIPVLAAHSLVPPTLPITGPNADPQALRAHIHRTCERASALGVRVLVLSSPAALRFPEGFEQKQAKPQILDFLRTAMPFFPRYELMLVAGPHLPSECNIITTLPEVLQYIWAVDHPNFQCLLDIDRIDSCGISIEQINDALPWVRHVRTSVEGPNIEPVFAELKRAKYQDLISVSHRTGSDLNNAIPTLKATWIAS